MKVFKGVWKAADFFESLCSNNKLARKYEFAFEIVSGLQGFLDVISANSSFPNVIAVDDTCEGYAQIDNSPHRRVVKVVYMSMRHAPSDQSAREICFNVMHEIFRQFMSVLIMERTKLSEQLLRLDPRISFSEMDRYFAAGSACAFFQISVDLDTDMRFNKEDWYE